ncbi:MAG: hypothetical protein JXB47_12510 [Anaerolineae bacterium]|nr:hypothetical protein [Anaerolineae bacterium]
MFPRTLVGGKSLPRLVIGTNWFMGFSHATPAKDAYIREHMDRRAIAEVVEVFFRAGVDAIFWAPGRDHLLDAIHDAQDRTGVAAIIIATPHLPVTPRTPIDGFDPDATGRVLDAAAAGGAAFCLPHQATTDATVDRCTRTLRKMDQVCRMIRERGMIPGLSTHMPEAITYADESGLDVETYISIYNALGFLMQLEVDRVARIIHHAHKPVLTIKPMAAGQLRPLQAFTFVWSTLRPQDMAAAGALSPREAEEVIELSLRILEKQPAV